MSHKDSVFVTNFVIVLAILSVMAFGFYFIAQKVVSTGSEDAPMDPMVEKQVRESIAPMARVRVAGDAAPAASAPAAAPAAVAAPAAAAPAGAIDAVAIYNKHCMACHVAGVAGAPKLGDAAAWGPRAAKGIDGLLATAKSGINAMPPMGTCMGCSDDEMKAVITHMLDNSK